jgi:hypothetical protein
MTLKLLFLSDLSTNIKLLVLLVHILITIGIKVMFEYPPPFPSEDENWKKTPLLWFKMLTSSCCCILVYMNINKDDTALKLEDNSVKNTFLSIGMYQ